MFRFSNRRYVLRTCAIHSSLFPSSHHHRKSSGCMSVARESIFFLLRFLFFLFNPLFRKSFPRQTDITRMACFAKSLVRAKAKSDDLSLSPKATSIFFLFIFYTYMESLSLSFSHSCYHSLTLFLSLFPELACRY